MKIKKIVTKQKLDHYFDLTSRALKQIKLSKKLTQKEKNIADDFLDFAKRYFSDAKYFRDKGDWVTAFAAVTYAHAWLDAGAKAKLFDVHDSNLFVVD